MTGGGRKKIIKEGCRHEEAKSFKEMEEKKKKSHLRRWKKRR